MSDHPVEKQKAARTLTPALANGLLGLHRALRLVRHPMGAARVLSDGRKTLFDARHTLAKLLLQDGIVIENHDETGSVCTRINRLGRVTVEVRQPALLSHSLVSKHAKDVDAEINALRHGHECLALLHGAATALPLLITGMYLALQPWPPAAGVPATLMAPTALGAAAAVTIAMGFHKFLRLLAAGAGRRAMAHMGPSTRFPAAGGDRAAYPDELAHQRVAVLHRSWGWPIR